MKNHEEIFTYIYDNSIWGHGSGGGSNINYNRQYVSMLEKLLVDLDIKTVIDFGCGDWQFSRFIKWGGVDYIGVDCVKSVIAENNKQFSKDGIRFLHNVNISAYEFNGDLLIVKDVLQHWVDEDIVSFLEMAVKRFKYILVTNSIKISYKNQDNHDIISRSVSCNTYPLNKFDAEVLYISAENPNDVKEISLITNK